MTRGIDVLIIAPHNAQVAASAVEKAKKQGVPDSRKRADAKLKQHRCGDFIQRRHGWRRDSSVKAQNLTGKTVVTGIDAQLDALQRIAQGEQTMTVYKPIQPLAYAAVEAAIKLAKKEPVATDKIKAVNREIPSIFIEPKAVDKANLMDVVRDGYHKFEAVYANVPADRRPKN